MEESTTTKKRQREENGSEDVREAKRGNKDTETEDINEDKDFNFIYDDADHRAKMVAHRLNQYVKFEFPDDLDEEDEPSYVELHLEENELTQTVYLKVVDYSDFDDNQEQYELWEDLVHSLKDIVGG